MARRSHVRTGLAIARIELLRSVRTILGDRRRLASGAVVALAIGLPYLGVVGGLYAAGDAVARGDAAIGTVVEGSFPGVLAGLVVLATVHRIAASPVPDGAELLLTTARTRAVVFGELCATGVTLYGTLVALVGPGLIAFALGAGSPATVPLVLALAVPAVASATATGYLLASAGALITRHLPHVTALKFGAYVGGLLAVGLSGPFLGAAVENGVAGPLEPLAAVPIADYALLGLLGTPAGAVTTAGLLTPVGLLGATAASTAGAVGLSRRLWFTDVGRGDDGTVSDRYAEVPRPFRVTASLRIAWRYLLLTRRAPRRLVHLTMFVFLVFPLAGIVAAEPDVIPTVAAGAAVVVGVLVSGGAFGLNPLGDEGAVLPALLVTGVGGRRLVHGRLLAGLSVGTPLATLGAVGLWVALELSVRAGLGLLVGTVVLSVAAGCIAIGLGCAVPKFEAESVFGVETVHPSRIPMMLYVYGGLVAVPVGLVLVAVPPSDVVSSTLHLAVLSGYVAVVAALSVVGYWYAVRRIDRYTL